MDRKVVRNVVSNINRDSGFREGFHVEVIGWETDSRPSAGEYAQQVINEQLLGDIDIFVGLLGHYFGQPTQKYSSGTEEEFEIAFGNFKEKGAPKIMFYFSEAIESVRDVEADQLAKRNSFRKGLENRGVYYFSYNDITSFQFDLHRHISQTVRELLLEDEEFSLQISDESTKALLNYDNLITTNTVILTSDLIDIATNELNSYTIVQSEYNKDISRVAKKMERSSRGIEQSQNSMNVKRFEREFDALCKGLEIYVEKLVDKIPRFANHFDNSMTSFQRAIAIMDDTEEGSSGFVSSIEGSILDAVAGLSELRDIVNSVESSFDEWPEHLERMHVAKLKIVSLHRDLMRHLDNSVETLQRLIENRDGSGKV